MKSILCPEARRVLRKFIASNTAIVLDYDGTLSPIVSRQIGARMRSQTENLLTEVAELYPTAVLSGRSVRDLRTRLGRGCFGAVVGNHGLEWEGSTPHRKVEKQVALWKRELKAALSDGRIHRDGIELEDKRLSLSMHYRESPDPTRANREIRAQVRRFPGLRVVGGKFLLNLVPDVGANKGTAVLSLRRKLRCDRVIFVGDDQTDEHVFSLPNKSFLLDIRVGRTQETQARYFLRGQKSVDRFLEILIEERERTCVRARASRPSLG